jgi:hypothetical protein
MRLNLLNESGKFTCLSLKVDKVVPLYKDTFDGSSKISTVLHCSNCKVIFMFSKILQ